MISRAKESDGFEFDAFFLAGAAAGTAAGIVV